jgi:ABC-2 type transport system ATP-binding protein
MLSIRNFSKKYHGRTILSVAEIDFSPGVYWIKGENGSGKSTFFKSVCGLIPFEGEILLGGFALKKDRKAYLQQVSYSEAEPSYPGFLTAHDLITFVGSARGSSEQKQLEIMSIFGLQEYAKNGCQSYSSGMLKKVSLALSFLGDTKVILLDEPFITLDAGSQKTLVGLIKGLAASGEKTFLISSHQSIENSGMTFNGTLVIKDKKLLPETKCHGSDKK